MFSFGGRFVELRDAEPDEHEKNDYAYCESLSDFIAHTDIYRPTMMQFRIALFLLSRRRELPDLTNILLDDLKLFVYLAYSKHSAYYMLTPSSIIDELNKEFAESKKEEGPNAID
jgi:hypothetical protein